MASEVKHTPGPWTITRSKIATDGAFDYAISAGGVPVIAEAFGRDAKGGWPDAEANAHLIAAAPELLEAIKELLEACDDEALDDADDDRHAVALDRQSHAMRAAQAAAAKAEGRS